MPSAFAAGTTLSFYLSYADFPASEGWTCTVHLTGRSSLAVSTSASGDRYLATAAATATAAMVAGVYGVEVRMEKDNAVYVAETAQVTVTPDTDVANATDRRAHAEKMLAQIEAELEARITGLGNSHDSYATAGDGFSQSIAKLSVEELRKARAIYAAEVQRLRNHGRLAPYAVHFARP